MREIDSNSDLGESFGDWATGDDAAMLRIASSANVAAAAFADRAFGTDGQHVYGLEDGAAALARRQRSRLEEAGLLVRSATNGGSRA